MPKESKVRKKEKRLAVIISKLQAFEYVVDDLLGRMRDISSDLSDISQDIESLREELQNE